MRPFIRMTLSVSRKKEVDLTYIEWNNQIAKRFFNEESAGTRVWFSAEKELIDEIARKNSVDFDHFIETVKKGPDWINRPNQTICGKASAVHDNWRSKKDLDYPPYIAYLALFVLAVNHGESDDFSENDYYGRLGDLVNKKLTTNHFKKTADLWDDLENWSIKDKRSALGEFHNDTFGKHFYVGMPLFQVVLKTEDRQNLPDIFSKTGWDSDSCPTEAEILKALTDNKKLLSNKTRKRIDTGAAAFLSVLTDRVLEELRDYDEEAEQPAKGQDKESAKRGAVEICLNIDKTAQKIDFYFRCKRKAGLPEEIFMLKRNGSEWKVILSSSILSQKIERFTIDDWQKDFTAESGKYKFHYKGEKYKIFTSAESLGASDWISGQKPLSNQFFYLAAHENLADKIQKWGQSECDVFQELDFSGLPKEQRLFEIKGIKGDRGIKQYIPALAIDEKRRIRFEGGIRLKRGNQFFDFALPKILVTGRAEQNPVYQTGDQPDIPLTPVPGEADIFNLPTDIPFGENIKIKIKSDESEVEAQKNLTIVKNRLQKFSCYSNQQAMDCFGRFKNQENPDESETECFAGAYCRNFKSKKVYSKAPQISLDEYKKIYLIGAVPGQIVAWPTDPWPDSWSPAWAIQFKNHKKGAACLIESKEATDNKEQGFSKKQIKLWKKIIWHNRKRIKSQSKKQWELQIKRAENV